ncbi:class Ib ribonucleoside-diphosphate reductase assembly flavoprotein NrdI [Bacillus sp. V3-13]|uniref:class Ib ribonucleoside-diphosphate reductase assembly flavoprotein NrdI n=1 Tax=Bacillus sp. V3-13 TaxID=2053728 RepID=UPI000C792921|nr:class Ib ribonucleoside-diphosphate reductase assembly flavoprotein NrdI [Bacillus sp. V3-13]PLR75408.1 class Ib ribonucleoside-diphosphate reductase assembly flavoprotein NrdI [Bacillus sp. V3-13]
MLVVYLSLTGNVRSFVQQVGMESIELNYANPLIRVNEEYIVIAPTYDDDITEVISSFIEYGNNIDFLRGFVGSGNKNFDNSYCFNAVDLAKKYHKPLIFKFEFSGTDKEKKQFKKEVLKIEESRTQPQS